MIIDDMHVKSATAQVENLVKMLEKIQGGN